MPNVIGVFDNSSQAHTAVERMIDAGIDRDQISFVTRDSGHEKAADVTTEKTSGAGKGTGIGAAVGGIGGLIAGIAGLAIPGIGPILAAGPIAAAIGGALGGAGLGAAAGGIIGALTDMGVPEDEARHYEDHVRQGKILVTVRADNDNEADRASDIMEEQGAVDVGERSRYGRVAESAPSATNVSEYERRDEGRLERQDLRTSETATIPVTEEQLVVGKRAVEGGRVRVYGRVSEKPVEESIRLRDESM